MKTTIRFRLSFSHLLVLLIGILLAGLLSWLAVEEIYLAAQRENLLAQARLTAAALASELPPFETPESYSQTTNISPGIHTRLLGESGAVLIGVPFPEGENPVQVPPSEDPGFVPAEELLQRAEIQSALTGTAATAIREIQTLDGKRVLYAAAPVFGDDGSISSLVYLATPLPDRRLPGEQASRLIGAIALAGLLASLIGLLIAKRLARPLENLDQAAAAVSSGNLNPEIQPESSIRELENLGLTFNTMTNSLRQAEETKNAFIADVTHELRTPLTVIKGTIETLEDGALDDQQGRDQLLRSMGQETNRLIHLVNDLLVLARSDAGVLALEIKDFNLAEFVRDRCENMQGLVGQKRITIQLGKEPNTTFRVLGDRSRTAQVLDNLLDNALRYAPSDSEITIFLQIAGDRALCSVQDRGPGIPQDQLPLIFERFYRVEKSRDRVSGGSGLGLAIARSLIEAQNGTIEVHSAPGEGAIFTFSLPLAN